MINNKKPQRGLVIVRDKYSEQGNTSMGFKEYLIEAEHDASDFEDFLSSYFEAALWSSTDDNDNPMDSNYDIEDIAPESIERSKQETQAFISQNKELLEQTPEDYNMGQAGHDFWLTRVGHGAGFWDRGLGDVGEALSESARKFGNVDIIVGDDGLLYFEG